MLRILIQIARCTFLAGFLFTASCSKEGSYQLVFGFSQEGLSDNVERIEIAIVPATCDNQTYQTGAVNPRSSAELRRGESLPALKRVPPGQYGLFARGISSADCVVAYSCTAPVNFKAGDDSLLRFVLEPLSTPYCQLADGGMCVCSACGHCDKGNCIPNHESCGSGKFCDPQPGGGCKTGEVCTAEGHGGCEAPADTCSTNHCNPNENLCESTTKGDGESCTAVATSAEGKCANGACCTGCFLGDTCVDGAALPWCGQGASVCEPCCTEPGCACNQGHCAPQMEALGGRHACAIRSNGNLYCWGDNGFGQLGIGSLVAQNRPVQVSLSNPVYVTAGEDHTCAIVASGDVYCWGGNEGGQSGQSCITSDCKYTTPQKVEGISRAVVIDANLAHTCAVNETGQVFCWGRNDSSQLGIANPPNLVTSPMLVQNTGEATAVTCGGSHTCALRRDGTMRCWGLNASAQLGDGSRVGGQTPRDVFGLSNVAQISAGLISTCALTKDNIPYTWGGNAEGQIGNGNFASGYVPFATAMPNFSEVKRLSIYREHACAALLSGEVRCWGTNAQGELATTGQRKTVPTQVLPSGYATTTVGRGFSCARHATSEDLICWGININGQLGDGTNTSRIIPAPVMFP